jgi:hypothetical protein
MTHITPTFIGIGSPKAATTWLSSCLNEHPEICLARNKETNLFLSQEFMDKSYGDMYKISSLDQYSREYTCTAKYYGEYCVNYILDHTTPEKIKKIFPDTKFIVCIRNPVAAMYSAYWYFKSMGRISSDTFEDALKESQIMHEDLYKYGSGLQKYFDIFPKERFKIYIYEDVMLEPAGVIHSLYEFLEVDANLIPSSLKKKVNSTGKAKNASIDTFVRRIAKKFRRSGFDSFVNMFNPIYRILNTKRLKYPPMNPETKTSLLKKFETDILLIENLTGRNLSQWRT